MGDLYSLPPAPQAAASSSQSPSGAALYALPGQSEARRMSTTGLTTAQPPRPRLTRSDSAKKLGTLSKKGMKSFGRSFIGSVRDATLTLGLGGDVRFPCVRLHA